MKNVNQFVNNIPFDKVIVFDRDGNQMVLTTYKIIIELDGKQYFIENHPHPRKPDGLSIYFDANRGNPKYFAVYPGGGNLVHLSINCCENL
ncbi:hypothetical protein SAMN06265171_105249 [Chryseobacterium rhizoplanae]|uniref:Uncharacterized protein n=1 Tax=Chryseobacterium rhizoplanae TaxID=1609531 RepID=A0A521DLU6_9FLAO|nr:hypothetical protein [Chryseobacterium rhizoplanae]SMO72575.1 hypothetical protein SAMN06265171_105249 [Chryseobacterium rhizoplanae]